MCSLFSVPVMIIVQWIPALLPRWGTNPAVASQTADYLRLLNWGTPWLLTYACFRRYLQGMHIVKPVTFALVTANLVNLVGNWLLIYGKFGLPQMGVRGSALSTVLARVYMAGFLVAVAIWHEHKGGGSFLAQFPLPNKRRILRILQLGGPAATQMIFEIGAFGGATVIAAKLSAESLAAHQIALNIASVTYMVPLGISAAAAVAVGHNIGSGETQPAPAEPGISLSASPSHLWRSWRCCSSSFPVRSSGSTVPIPGSWPSARRFWPWLLPSRYSTASKQLPPEPSAASATPKRRWS